MYALDKKTGNVSVRRVADIASKRRLLTERDDKLMKELEDSSTIVIDEIRKGKLKMRSRDRRTLDRLVLALMRNDPYSGINYGQIRRNIISTVGQGLTDAFATKKGQIDSRWAQEFVSQRSSHDYLTMLFSPDDNLVLKMLGLMRLREYRPADGSFFVIGDSPVLIVRGMWNGTTNLAAPDSQIILPIHSRRLLVYSWDASVSLLESGPVLHFDQVHSLNTDYFAGTDCRYVFGRRPEILRQANERQYPVSPTNRHVEVGDGWRMMLKVLQETSHSRATRAAVDHKRLLDFAEDAVRRASLEGDEGKAEKKPC